MCMHWRFLGNCAMACTEIIYCTSFHFYPTHSLIRGILMQSCSAGAKNFSNYVFCHVQFRGDIQNIENCCAIRAKF